MISAILAIENGSKKGNNIHWKNLLCASTDLLDFLLIAFKISLAMYQRCQYKDGAPGWSNTARYPRFFFFDNEFLAVFYVLDPLAPRATLGTPRYAQSTSRNLAVVASGPFFRFCPLLTRESRFPDQKVWNETRRKYEDALDRENQAREDLERAHQGPEKEQAQAAIDQAQADAERFNISKFFMRGGLKSNDSNLSELEKKETTTGFPVQKRCTSGMWTRTSCQTYF